MRCEDFDRRLKDSGGRADRLPEEMREHLRECSSCARLVEADKRLESIFKAASVDDPVELMPLESRMQGISEKASMVSWAERLSGLVSVVVDAVSWGNRRLALSGVALAAILALVTLVPFGYDKIVAYNLTIGGVCPEVAGDDEIVCALFLEQGINEATIDVTGCDTTCSLVVFDLKSEAEVELAMATYEDLGAEATIEGISIITDRGSSSLLGMAKDHLFNN